jgi:hypothetical protein
MSKIIIQVKNPSWMVFVCFDHPNDEDNRQTNKTSLFFFFYNS